MCDWTIWYKHFLLSEIKAPDDQVGVLLENKITLISSLPLYLKERDFN